MQLRTQPELPCFCGCQALRKVAKGQLGQKQDRRCPGLCCWGSLLARSEQFLSLQLGSRSTEMRQGHLGLWVPTSGGQGDLSLHTGKAGRRKKVWPSLKCSCSLQESLFLAFLSA